MSAKIGSLNVDVTLETARFKSGVRQVQAETSRLEKSVLGISKIGGAAAGALAGFGSAVILGGLQSAVSGAFELASSMSEAAGRIGVTVEALQALRVAATDNGVSNEALESSFGRLNVQLGDLQSGSKKATDAFAAIGLSAAQLKGLSPDEAFGAIADKIAAIKDPTLQAAAAQDIFGKSYAQLLPLIKGGSQALKEAADESRRNGQISTQDAKDLDYLADSWEKLKVRVGVATAQIIAAAARMPGEIRVGFQQISAFFTGLADSAIGSVERLVTGVRSSLVNKLGAVWKFVTDKIETVRRAFFNLYDAVVGNSYVPDMVDGIEAEMARLDAAMVDPAVKATKSTGDSFRQLAGEVQSILDRLFPQIAKARRYAAEATVLGGIKDPGARTTALRALGNQEAGLSKEGLSFDLEEATKPLVGIGEGVEQLMDRLADLPARAKETTVRVAKTFKDMATETIGALSRLSDAIKGGGFLSILEGIVGLGIQLGSIGAFGKKIQTNINASVPGYANGGYPSRGLALVGERGPELVRFRGGERVYNNTDSRAMMGGRQTVEIIDTTGLFRFRVGQQIVESSPAIMAGGARVAQSQMAYRQTRRVA